MVFLDLLKQHGVQVFTPLEITTLIARSLTLRPNQISHRCRLVHLAALVAVPFAGASAQRRPPEPPPKVMISTFASADKDLGIQAAEALRSRITRDVDAKRLTVIPKADINNTLGASGYSTTEALGSNDAKALANLLRADEYMEGTVLRTPTGVKIDARLVLARDNKLQQPLPSAEAPNLDRAAQAVAKSYQQARDQLASERNCNTLLREKKFAEAEVVARSGLSKYPNGTIVGVCLGTALDEQKKTDSVLALAERIRAVDPRNVAALRWAADIYRERGNKEKATQALTGLLAAEPGNEVLLTQVVNDLAGSGQAKLAVPIIMEAVRANPGDPKLLRIAWLVLLAAKEYSLALQTGSELIRADTAAADSTYFVRSVAAASELGQPAQAAQIVAQGIARFPNNASLLLVQAAALSKAGQNAQALTAARRAVQMNPKVEGGYAQLALIYGALGQPDSVASVINLAAANGGDKKTLAQVALKTGSDAYKAGNASKNRAELQRAVKFLQLSDQLDASPDAKFLAGASAFLVGQSAVNEAQETKNCALARLAKESFATAQENVPAGLTSYADAAKQLLNAIPQFTPAVDDQIRRFCR